jgi:hypothetical protein
MSFAIWIYLKFGIWDLNDFILEKEELLNQSEFYKLYIGHHTRRGGGYKR